MGFRKPHLSSDGRSFSFLNFRGLEKPFPHFAGLPSCVWSFSSSRVRHCAIFHSEFFYSRGSLYVFADDFSLGGVSLLGRAIELALKKLMAACRIFWSLGSTFLFSDEALERLRAPSLS